MDTKEHIEQLLFSLKRNGIDRDEIEKDLNYSPNYISQVLSKGGNQRFLTTLQKYSMRKLTNQKSGGSLGEDEQAAYTLRTNAYLAVLLDTTTEILALQSGLNVASLIREKLEAVRREEARLRAEHGES